MTVRSVPFLPLWFLVSGGYWMGRGSAIDVAWEYGIGCLLVLVGGALLYRHTRPRPALSGSSLALGDEPT